MITRYSVCRREGNFPPRSVRSQPYIVHQVSPPSFTANIIQYPFNSDPMPTSQRISRTNYPFCPCDSSICVIPNDLGFLSACRVENRHALIQSESNRNGRNAESRPRQLLLDKPPLISPHRQRTNGSDVVSPSRRNGVLVPAE